MFSSSAMLSLQRPPEFRIDALLGAIALTVLISSLLCVSAYSSIPWAFFDFGGGLGRGRLLRVTFIVAMALWAIAAGALCCLADSLEVAERKGDKR